ncbi:MAG: uracil-xanthine permease [Lachnospiraceae bacterium]|nr:uracil-xanthine permease [Lachnospiraceae bacterium]
MKLIYDVEDKPKLGQLLVFAIQQLLAIMTATLVVPIIINSGVEEANMSSAAALFGAGIGTLIYVLFTKKKSPVFLGSSFAFIGSMLGAFAGATTAALGYLGLILGAVLAGLVYVVIALIVKFSGVNWVNKLMPAVVIGPTVAIIGLSLAGNAVGDLVTGGVKVAVPDYSVNVVDGVASIVEGIELKSVASPLAALLAGLVTLGVTMICSVYGKKSGKLIPFIYGILSGYAFCLVMTLIGNATDCDAIKLLSFDSFKALTADGVGLGTFFSIPDFTFMSAFGAFGEINGSYIGTLFAAYVPVAFVVFAEHIADHKNISSIIERDLLEDPGLHRTLLGDGVGSMVGAIFGGCPNTTYGESIGCVAITKNASVYTIITAAIGAIVISFISPFIAFVNSIPSCVMGGVCMALYGFIAVSGLKMVQGIDLNKNKNLFVVSVILIAGIGGLTVNFGDIAITEVACALILGILANLLLKNGPEEE